MKLLSILIALAALAGCAGDRKTCTVSVDSPTERMASEYNGKCRPGEVLVGYDPNAIGGPLFCATASASCPIAK